VSRRLLRRASRRHLLRHPWQLGLATLGVALGVGIAVAIDLANQSAAQAFRLSMEQVGGRATHQLVGGPGGLDEQLYARLRVQLGLEEAAPVVERTVTALGNVERPLRLLGIDPLAEGPFRARLLRPLDGRVELATLLTEPATALLSAPTARELGVAVGERLALRIGTARRDVRIIGMLEPQGRRERLALADLLVADVSVAQELTATSGRLSHVDLLLEDSAAGEALADRLHGELPEDVRLVRAGGRTEAMASMTRAFQLNLTALSLLAVVVGMFLIYNTMTFAVLQRRQAIGLLRALGVTRGEIFRLVLVEAAVIGAVGTGLGVLAGVWLGQGLVDLVARTINDLYFVLTVRELAFAPVTAVKALALGLGATLAAALLPALEAAGAAPRKAMGRSLLELRWRRRLPAVLAAGLGLGAAGGLLLAVSGDRLELSFTGFFLLIVGAALLVPPATVVLAAGLAPPARVAAGPIAAMAVRGVRTTLSRTGVAIAALAVALSVAVGVGVMIDSFRGTVERWLGLTLQADVYVSPPDLGLARGEPTLPDGLVDALREVTGVAATATVRRVELQQDEGLTALVVLDVDEATRPRYDMVAAADDWWDAFRRQGAVLLSEPFARRRGLAVGEALALPTDRGPAPFRVAGVFHDYGSDQGAVTMHRDTYERDWSDRAVSGASLYLAPGVDPAAVVRTVRTRLGSEHALHVRSNRTLRETSLEIFDRTFTITAVLRALAVLVAFIGVLSALMALQLERVREIGVLRANGLTPRQVWQLVLTQTGLMGLAAGLLSLPIGWMLAVVMIRVINVRSFGWTLRMDVDAGLLLQAVGVGFVAALLAGLYPAYRMSRISPALALREE
jgi:putative ABC transport system permease protein